MVADKNNNDGFILGGDYRIPIVEGLQPANYIYSQENSQAMDEAGFAREYKTLLYSINIMNCWDIQTIGQSAA